jgi:LysR family hydrogen peroxide-inducible transcriptional activator
MMNLRDLEYFEAVAELRHFGKAAERCFVSQPTLSGQVKKLEEELGVSLFERGRGGVILTNEGQELLANVQEVLTASRRLVERAKALRDPMAGRVRMGIFPTLSPYLLPHVVDKIHKAFPDLEIYLVEDQTHRIEEKLRNGDLDVLVLALPVEDSRFEIRPLFKEPFQLAVPAGHELGKEKKLTIQHLDGRSILLLEDGHCLRAQVLDVCMSAGAKEFQGFRATSLETLRQMVAAGTGITLIPELAVRRDLNSGDTLNYVHFKKPEPFRELGMVWRKNSPRAQLFEAIGEVIRAEAEKALSAG